MSCSADDTNFTFESGISNQTKSIRSSLDPITMKKLIFTLSCCFLGFGTTALFAQQGPVSAGGTASGTGGTVTYSIGQVFFTFPSGTSHNLIQGLQQPFEISSLAIGIENYQSSIQLFASVFPNPAVDRFTLQVESNKQLNLTCALLDMQGRVLVSKKIESDQTLIETDHLANAQYLLKVFEGDQEIKTFKVVKIY